MKKLLTFLVIVSLILSSCALIPKKTVQIKWPENIQYIEALCELDMSWKDTKYSGSMSLKLEYPDKLMIDIFGPFGDTVFHLNKDKEKFLLVTKEGSTSSDAGFEQDFGIKLSDFIEDLAIKPCREGCVGNELIQRDNYKIKYNFDGSSDSSICWEIKDNSMCITFIEAKFEKH
jgi:hypothetical protein